MHGATFPRVPGIGLAPATEARHINARERDALMRDTLAREDAQARAEATLREPCPPADRHDTVRRPVRAGAA